MSWLLQLSDSFLANRISRIGAALFLTSMIGCGDGRSPAADVGVPAKDSVSRDSSHDVLVATPDALYSFDLNELIELQSKALSGDGDAAYSLSEYYSIRKQWPEADRWDQIGAENGNPISAEKVAKAHWALGGFHNCQRAVFWLKRAMLSSGTSSDELKVRDLEQTVNEIERDDTNCLWAEIRK